MKNDSGCAIIVYINLFLIVGVIIALIMANMRYISEILINNFRTVILIVFIIASYFILRNGKVSERELAICSLLILIIRRDSQISEAKKEKAIQYIRENFAKRSVLMISALNKLQDAKIKEFRTHCITLNKNNSSFISDGDKKLSYDEKLKFLETLYEIAATDNGIVPMEVIYLREIARFLHINKEDRNQIEVGYGVDEETQRRREYETFRNNIYVHSREYSLEVLGLKEGTSIGEIKRAYRRLAMKYHPDKQKQDATDEQRANAREMFRKVNEAYNHLCNL